MLPEEKDVTKTTIGKESFIFEIEAPKEYVRKHGKKLAKEQIELEDDSRDDLSRTINRNQRNSRKSPRNGREN